MKTLTMHEAKTHLSRYVDAALAGEEVVIGRRNEPLVRLVPVQALPKRREVGTLNDLVLRMGSAFNESVELESDGLLGRVTES